MKLVLFVEGYTERKALPDFFKRWLDPKLVQPIGIKVVRFDGWRNYADEIARKVELNCSGKVGADVVGAIGLLDLYGPTFYPRHMTAPEARYDWAKEHLESKVSHPLFRQHFAVHETEAWLLAAPALLPKVVSGALPGRCDRPETVNFNEPPAKLLERLYREKLQRNYKKVTDGANFFQKLSPEVAQAKCPYLKRLLEEMLALARQSVV